MQTSRVNGLTSGVFAFLVPASCLNQKGSNTRRDNTTFPVADYYPHLPVFVTKTGNDSNLLIVFYVQIMPDDFVMQLHRF
ncbi:hypothetical protein D3088_24715 [Escherichia coli]|nr:hypothetical protein [Escherichia coli]EFN9295933.1 hypothetical protein [Escherichia coli]